MAAAGSGAVVRRAMLRALLRAADRLDAQLSRFEPVRARELAALRRAAMATRPTTTRNRAAGGLLLSANRTSDHALTAEVELKDVEADVGADARVCAEATAAAVAGAAGNRAHGLSASTTRRPAAQTAKSVVRADARIVTAKHARAEAAAQRLQQQPTASDSSVPESIPAVPDLAFRVLKHLNRRAAALERLVYNSESEAITENVRVRVTSSFQRFEQAAKRYCFQYDVKLTNESDKTMQLLSRRWIIHDLNGGETEVVGPGVVGAFPVLQPGQSYEYSSGTPLATPLGTQSGHFLFVYHGPSTDEVQGNIAPKSTKTVVINVAPFALQKLSVDLATSNGSTSSSVDIPAEISGSPGKPNASGSGKQNTGSPADSGCPRNVATASQTIGPTKMHTQMLRRRRGRRLRRKR
jgi:ApaG protein